MIKKSTKYFDTLIDVLIFVSDFKYEQLKSFKVSSEKNNPHINTFEIENIIIKIRNDRIYLGIKEIPFLFDFLLKHNMDCEKFYYTHILEEVTQFAFTKEFSSLKKLKSFL
jgi:hypothetical protein